MTDRITGVQHRIGSGFGAGSTAVEVDQLDLGDLGSVAAFAERFLASGRDIDMVINSAGIMACPARPTSGRSHCTQAAS